jgi:hypothetical protein
MKSYFFNAVIFTVLLTSCFSDLDKEEELSVKSENLKELHLIQSFPSWEEKSELDKKLVAMTHLELKEFEEGKGYYSLGRFEDALYREAASLSSYDEVVLFVQKNSEYLSLSVEPDGEMSLIGVHENHPNRYTTNINGLFQIENMYFKQFEKGIAFGNQENMQYLVNLSEEQFESGKSNASIEKRYYPELPIVPVMGQTGIADSPNNCTAGFEIVEPSGNNRHKLKINLFADPRAQGYDFMLHYKFWPQKKTFGIWFNAERTINGSAELAVDYQYYGSTWERFFTGTHTKTNYLAYKWEMYFTVSYSQNSPYQSHFGGYDIYADTPTPPAFNEECNTHLF